MSGGSYSYAYRQIESLAAEIRVDGACYCAPAHLRRAFSAHLLKVAEAARAIEWNDSCDGDHDEEEKILACVGPSADLETATDAARKAVVELSMAIRRAEEVTAPRS